MKRTYHWVNHLLNFLAVILGVYLAFYINDRAQAAEEKKEYTALMQSLIHELSADIKTYETYQIPVNKAYLEQIDTLLTLLTSKQLEEANQALGALFQVENYVPSNSTYISIKSAGKFKLIQDLSLQKQLSDFYDGTALECIKKTELQADYFMEKVMDWMTRHADLIEMQIQAGADLTVLQNILLIYHSLVDQKIRSYEQVVDESNVLMEGIQALLEK